MISLWYVLQFTLKETKKKKKKKFGYLFIWSIRDNSSDCLLQTACQMPDTVYCKGLRGYYQFSNLWIVRNYSLAINHLPTERFDVISKISLISPSKSWQHILSYYALVLVRSSKLSINNLFKTIDILVTIGSVRTLIPLKNLVNNS